ncbi:hypothetical protein A3C91_00275 [Candidatus Azambacteria bacterium RIFCSPHIGHO2_02_FULL_52_12]|uniref:Type II secretion system protein GspG C-terminal domain-containing protein n=1 Tax=Candidatus Azambacteria bacterium RIFCSPLOWO2_01_FULL_46_25 TaxID=1797298 RepID=A0A1F5BUK0_9BACT|nr:MAG: hypothetical protein A3C91_00275 [Candidatus Azambacteria bacterium RIFCSPHIGHO2_02_FULL_52_12]OGD34296.1 MAG: hypothetical protein A2988_02085 [Candidatus Azambacteria bacterium RIFCSPLOWO2_01_FULL_46_25]OGD37555.1 MAG: hypothetical protein A2850_00725 [Candidatus Azambacteria bacterium RIFCSPHIGHO2_01_FULL_51_74]
MTNSRKKGFTLLELLIVITILAILTLVVVLFINPVEILKKSRDVQRMSDLDITRTAINLYLQDSASNTLGGTTYCTASVPASESNGQTLRNGVKTSLVATTAPVPGVPGYVTFTNPSTVYANATTTADLALANGKGWIPGFDFTTVGSGAPIAKLPIDPTNTATLVTGEGPGINSLYYRYACKTNNTFELDATLESLAYGPTAGLASKAASDGGNSVMRYEVGTDLTIIASTAPIL